MSVSFNTHSKKPSKPIIVPHKPTNLLPPKNRYADDSSLGYSPHNANATDTGDIYCCRFKKGGASIHQNQFWLTLSPFHSTHRSNQSHGMSSQDIARSVADNAPILPTRTETSQKSGYFIDITNTDAAHLHHCRYEIYDHLSLGAGTLLLCVAGIALFSLTSSLVEPCGIKETPGLEVLHRAYDLPMDELRERLVPNLNQLDFITETVYNVLTDPARAR